MSLLIDAILAAVMIFCIVYYAKKGFAASLLGLIRFWIALALALLFSGPLAEKLQPIISEKIGNGNENFFSVIVNGFVSSGYVARVLAFAILFAAAVILVKLLEMALRLLSRIPVIGGLNKILGTLLGLLVGFFWISLLSLILMAMAEYLSGSIPGLTHESFKNTILAKFLYENNIFRLLFEKLSAG